MEKDKYSILAEQLLKAIDIANEALQKFPPKGWSEVHIGLFIVGHERIRISLVQSKKLNLRIIKEGTSDLLTYFQEAGGRAVEYFWTTIKEAGLPFKRENKMTKILKRKKINNIGEYDFVIDTIVPYKQEGFIDENDIALLNIMIAKFEEKHKP